MITLRNKKTKKEKSYTDKKARLIMANELLGKDYEVVGAIEKAPTPPEAKIDLDKPKKKK